MPTSTFPQINLPVAFKYIVAGALLSLLPQRLPARNLETIATKQLAPGIVFQQQRDSSLPVIIDCVVVDLKNPHVHVHVAIGQDSVTGGALGKGREDVTSMARRHGAIVAINGDYFPYTGDPLGVGIASGELFSEPWTGKGKGGPRTTLSFNSDGTRAILAKADYLGDLQTADGTRMFIDGLDRPPGVKDLVLCDNHYGSEITVKSGGAIIVARPSNLPLRANKLMTCTCESVILSDGISVSIQPGMFVLAASPGSRANLLRQHLHVGDPLSIVEAVSEPGTTASAIQIAQLPREAGDMPSRSGLSLNRSAYVWATASEAIGGGPRLLHSGQSAIDGAAEGFDASFTDHAFPRTAAGTNADGSQLVLVTVDGRQRLSRGATLAELTAILRDHGASEAMNFDGGGSTAMAIAGVLVNNPDGSGSERPVADGLLISSDSPWIIPYRTPVSKAPPNGFDLSVQGDNESSQESDGSENNGSRSSQFGVGTSGIVLSARNPLSNGQPMSLVVGGQRIAGDSGKIIWQGSAGVGIVDQKGVLLPDKDGVAHVAALYNGKLYRTSFKVSAPDALKEQILTLSLAPLTLTKQLLTIACATRDHKPLVDVPLTVQVTGGIALVSAHTNADGYASVEITWTNGSGGSATVTSPGYTPTTIKQK